MSVRGGPGGDDRPRPARPGGGGDRAAPGRGEGVGGGRRVLRTLAWAVGIALALALLLRPLDAVGTYMGFPPSYHLGARILLTAFWLVGMAAVWAYRPAHPRGNGSAEEPDAPNTATQ